MKNLIGILVILIMNTAIFASQPTDVDPIPTDAQPSLIVMAKSGLKLRLTPSTDAPVLDVINYGAEVTKSEDFVESRSKFTINWVEGSWIKVNYNNQVGFIFDGFVSGLPVPMDDSEIASSINDLGYAVYSWAHHNYDLIDTDTLTFTETALTTLSTIGEHKLFIHDAEYMTKVEMTFTDTRIMDVYHLLESMMDTRSARSIFKENTMFFSGPNGKVDKLKIAGGQIVIREMGNGEVKVSCQTIHEGC